ncbi:TAR (HIV-1) RNA binding protein 1 [Phyllostomus discolor]|uniref:TAR (HIV-1) RNA binding protein 1 n=1 Tax=Phyllostomus discolor TaxID=89673 RepID=A0A833YGB3_9CHIR|nr:TAR (HIV-1) RNA binding protein 1 [Phyllostomus discolor]
MLPTLSSARPGHVRGASRLLSMLATLASLPAAVSPPPGRPWPLPVGSTAAVSVGVGSISSRLLIRVSYRMSTDGGPVVLWGGGGDDTLKLFLSGSFLLKFIQKMTSRHWCAVPILFLSKALAGVPRCRALGLEGLLALRDVLQCTMATHQILLRGAAQGYLLQTAMNLLDVEKVSLSDISAFLLSLRQEESLARGTSLWTEVRLKII